ncbi:MAG: PilZ domain-containing protein, partial [Deltaproteobacteria bacterium]
PRHRLAFPVLIDGPHGIRRCIADDISARGLFVETVDAYPVGTSVRVIFALPDGSWEMTVRCTVRRVLRLEANDGSLHGVGLSFESVEDDLSEQISFARRLHA